jgi:hypothetical protein
VFPGCNLLDAHKDLLGSLSLNLAQLFCVFCVPLLSGYHPPSQGFDLRLANHRPWYLESGQRFFDLKRLNISVMIDPLPDHIIAEWRKRVTSFSNHI